MVANAWSVPDRSHDHPVEEAVALQMKPDIGAGETHDPRAGARNLLLNCVGMQAGQDLLFVTEPPGLGYFDDDIAVVVANEARSLGGNVNLLEAPPSGGPDDFPADVAAAMRQADHTIFFSRLGDQLRFCALPGTGSKTMATTLEVGYLGAELGRVPHGLFEAMYDRLVAAIRGAGRYRIRCPLGTDLEMTFDTKGDPDAGRITTDFTVKPFPVMIFPPLSCAAMSGRLVLARWLTSTAVRAYDDSVLTLETPVTAHIEAGRIVRFEGEPAVAAEVERQFERIGAQARGDAHAVESWHAGINPKCFFIGDPAADVERWGNVIYGSPRATHFHMCGTNPGEMACTLIDASIWFDDALFWDAGRFRFLDRPEIQALMSDYPGSEGAFAMRRDIGV